MVAVARRRFWRMCSRHRSNPLAQTDCGRSDFNHAVPTRDDDGRSGRSVRAATRARAHAHQHADHHGALGRACPAKASTLTVAAADHRHEQAQSRACAQHDLTTAIAHDQPDAPGSWPARRASRWRRTSLGQVNMKSRMKRVILRK
jgi:hypothetical protein